MFQFFWVFSKTTNVEIIDFGRAAKTGDFRFIETMTVRYMVDYSNYTATYTRNETPLWEKSTRIRYSTLFPGISRLDSFAGNWMEPLLYYLIFFLGTTIIFFVPSDILPKGILFEFSKNYPWIRVAKKE